MVRIVLHTLLLLVALDEPTHVLSTALFRAGSAEEAGAIDALSDLACVGAVLPLHASRPDVPSKALEGSSPPQTAFQPICADTPISMPLRC